VDSLIFTIARVIEGAVTVHHEHRTDLAVEPQDLLQLRRHVRVECACASTTIVLMVENLTPRRGATCRHNCNVEVLHHREEHIRESDVVGLKDLIPDGHRGHDCDIPSLSRGGQS
jgi:hypothetical protein